ncbi:MAG TPA: rhomboid family intramembrane serine protease [Saprospiraceae bacterium]|nr:rhomboid family intramembrane serine protease [Saprospiraceae bacterium]HMP25692.1 rhomboid family intramembrane serine protease [Saprospiraceae bacterium]
MFQKLSLKLRESLLLPAYLIVAIWLVHLLQVLSGFDLGWLGVYPLKGWGLRGVLFMPLLHGGWGHLLANTPPLFMLGAMLVFFYRRVAFSSFIMIYLLSGLFTWLMPFQMAWHIGASAVLYGLWAFVLSTGILRRNIRSIALALIVLFYFGSMFVGIFPGGKEHVSWQGHLAGAIAGVFTAFWFREAIERDEEKPRYSWDEHPQEDAFFLNRDAFEKTKAEREQERQSGFPDWFSNKS